MGNEFVALSTVREQFCIEDKGEALKLFVDAFRETIGQEEACELLLSITGKMEEALETEGKTFTPIEKITWTVKEIFIAGVVEGVDKMMALNEETYKYLAGKEVEVND